MWTGTRSIVRPFVADCRGNFAMMFALFSPVLVIVLAVALGFADTITLDEQAQAAADSAALAATETMAGYIKNPPSDMTQGQAQTLAQTAAANYFASNAPQEVVSGETAFTATTAVNNNVVTTTVAYSGVPKTVMSGIVGSAMNVDVTASSTETVTLTTTTTTPQGTYAGTGWVAEDPVVTGAEGQYWFMLMCDVSHATWYNMLSDTGFEVNANCDGTSSWAELYQFSVLAGSHVISITPALVGINWYGTPMNQEVWSGGVTIDGVYYAAASGTNTYLNDTANGITVSVIVGQPGVSGSAANYVLIATPTYSITVAYDSDDNGSWNLGLASINFAATNAGACGTPGGLWGQTLSGSGNDNSMSDFAVGGPTATVSQFSRTCSTTTTTATTTMPILVQ